MPNTNIEQQTYVALINRAIEGFNKIYTSLDTFKITKDENTVIRLLDNHKDEGKETISIENYATAISDLVYMINSDGVKVRPSAVINAYDYSGISTYVDSKNDFKYELTGETESRVLNTYALVPASGYYKEGSRIKTSISVRDNVELASTNLNTTTKITKDDEGKDTETIDKYYYSVTNGDNPSLLASVVLNPSTLTVTEGSGNAGTFTNSVSADINKEGTKIKTTTTENSYALKFDLSASIDNTKAPITVEATATATEGFTPGGSVEFSKNVTVNQSTSGTKTVYIQAGSVSTATGKDDDDQDIKVTPSLSDDETKILATSIADDKTAADYYTITGSIAATEIAKIKTTVTEGYVTAASSSIGSTKNIKTDTKTMYIAKGSVDDVTVDTLNISTTTGSGFFTTTANNNKVTIQSKTDNAIGMTYNDGYIKNKDKKATVSVDATKDFYITAGSVTPTYSIDSNYKISHATGTKALPVTTDTVNNGYCFTITPSVSLDGIINAGWIPTNGISWSSASSASGSTNSKTFYIASSTDSISTSVTTTSHDVKTADDKNPDKAPGNLTLWTTKPTAGDYYQIDFTTSSTLTAGYTAGYSVDVVGEDGEKTGEKTNTKVETLTRYIPKAVLEFVEKDDQGNDSYYKVTTAGYLPEGIISDISIAEDIQAATIQLGRDTNSSIAIAEGVTAATASKYHKFIVSETVTQSGYISSNVGEVTNKEFYVNKSVITTDPALANEKTPIAISKVATESDPNYGKYKATTKVKAVSNLSVSEGYVSSTEAGTFNNSTMNVSDNIDVDYFIDQAGITGATHTSVVSQQTTTVAAAGKDESELYVITPQIDSCSTSISLSAGYTEGGAVSLTDKITHTNDTLTPFVIHAGTGVVLDTTEKEVDGEMVEVKVPLAGTTSNITVLDNFTSTVDGDYTISLSGTTNVNGGINLDVGYYGSSNKNVSVDNITLNKEVALTVKHGKVVISTSGSAEIASNDITFVAEKDKVASKTYLEMTASGSFSGSIDTDNTVEGYIKTSDIKTTEGSTTEDSGTDKIYVEKYVGSYAIGTTDGNATTNDDGDYVITIGQANETIATASEISIPTAEKYSKADIKVQLSQHAIGSSVMESLASFEARLNGTGATIVEL